MRGTRGKVANPYEGNNYGHQHEANTSWVLSAVSSLLLLHLILSHLWGRLMGALSLHGGLSQCPLCVLCIVRGLAAPYLGGDGGLVVILIVLRLP